MWLSGKCAIWKGTYIMKRAVFLDRDGVIVEDSNYVYRTDQLRLIPGSAEAIKLLNENCFLTIIVTNQAGVAKGYFTERDIMLFNNSMKEMLIEHGAHIDAIYYCPHHPDAKIEKYKINCYCRKPKPGMLEEAEKDFNIDIKQSFMIGDKLSDVNAGKYVGCRTIMVLTGYGKYEPKNDRIDYIAQNLYSAVRYILSYI